MTLQHLNALSGDDAQQELLRCCGARGWAAHMAKMRPYHDAESVSQESEIAFGHLAPGDWREAFGHHPRIGAGNALRAQFSTLAATKDWADGEQAGTRAAAEDTLRALGEKNAEYEAKFGYVFIVCATGKSAAEMLHILEARLPNNPDDELAIAARQQRQITRLRLEKWLDE